ncbi:MAG: glycosyltransferase [Rhodospirillales bacterium]|nr:glycosyltransferase [Rhodospirillales bacterium]
MDSSYSKRKDTIREHADLVASTRDSWIDKNRYFYENDYRYMRFLIPEGLRILEIGCGTGCLLSELRPGKGVGVDLSTNMIEVAKANHPQFEFHVGDAEDPKFMKGLGGPFDVIVISDTIGSLSDCQKALENLRPLCTPETRIIVAYYSVAWAPLLRIAQGFGGKMPQPQQNWLTAGDIGNLLTLSQFEVIKREWRQLVPKSLFGIGGLLNRFIAPLPLIRLLCLRNYVVARPAPNFAPPEQPKSVTVLIPCRNERGNIEAAIKRIPAFCKDMEILYVEGGSSDGTLEEVRRVIEKYPKKDIKVLVQTGKGKGDAVRLGFEAARGEVLMILDADLTMPPEDLPKFFEALALGQGEFINGSRLVYPMEDDAMRFLNLVANKVFSWLFSWLLNQRFTDTLCGTKVLRKSDYEMIRKNRGYFGDFDPFGDFDLIFGAAKLNLKVAEIPVRYAERVYGETQISRFRHGWLLLKMVIFAFRKLKAF